MSETTAVNPMASIMALGEGRPWRPALLAIAILAQLVLPIRTVMQHESVVTSGREYRFRTMLVDPYDPFRGRYVQLGFEETELSIDHLDPQPEAGERVYARIETGADGFARLTDASIDPPERGDYLRVDIRWVGADDDIARVDLPFDRYYMNEDAAPEAERVFRERVGTRGDDGEMDDGDFVIVRVEKGIAVLESLYVDDQPIEALLEAGQADEAPEFDAPDEEG
jgi:uncharacterized membrane-anchored protein